MLEGGGGGGSKFSRCRWGCLENKGLAIGAAVKKFNI